MLSVSKKKIIACRILMWGGIALIVAGAIFYYISTDLYIDISLILLFSGFIITLLGSFLMQQLFRCPNCKKTVLSSEHKVDLRSTNCPTQCPNCGTPIQLVD